MNGMNACPLEISLQDLSHQRIRQALVLVMLHYSTIGSY